MDLFVSPDGRVTANGQSYACALGRGGIGQKEREGDGITPLGCYPLREVFFRPDRLEKPATGLPVRGLQAADGWCDDPGHPAYNKRISKPFSASHEDLWREDHLYDLIVVVGFNDDPIVPAAGSAIFIHLARPDFSPTEGCVALRRVDLLALLGLLDPTSRLVVEA
ncbi:MAG: L,D-transpeptidase family protein [Magnetovibrionaceae bacterium]